MLLASLVGTTFGDFISTALGLGFVRGLLPLGVCLAALFLAERKIRYATEAYYWTAIVLTRTMATNLADLATHGLKLDYGWLELALFALMAAVLLYRRSPADLLAPSSTGESDGPKTLPGNDARYWLLILIASTIGTSLGDFTSDNLGLGVGRASLCLAPLLAISAYWQLGSARSGQLHYWLAIILVRMTGTVMGDFLSGDDGLGLGFSVSALGSALLLAGLLHVWKSGRIPDIAPLEEASAGKAGHPSIPPPLEGHRDR